ncbi:MAG: response regulator transcription factor [Arenimonas sp.]|jgi:DNA-binding response OmpR family regulator|nr:response regulator transcription factor [Arenimonas sp.]MBP6309328.1 response regulator transcription factor [Arenimonas sp.]
MKKNDRAGLILLIEDNRNLSEVMGEFFEQKGFGVDFASDGLDGYRLACQNSYDVIVLDLNLPRMDGLQVCEKLRLEAKISTPILMLTARDAVPDKVLGFQAGADDYLIKPFAIQELEVRIRSLIRRERKQVSTAVYQVADLILDTGSLRATRAGLELNLSPIALRLLAILMRESPRVVSRRDIEREIWGDDLPESDTLRSHLYNLRKSVDRSNDKQLLHTVQTAGYRIVDLGDQAKP